MSNPILSRLPAALKWLVPYQDVEISSALTQGQVKQRIQQTLRAPQPIHVPLNSHESAPLAVTGKMENQRFQLFALRPAPVTQDERPVGFAKIYGEIQAQPKGTLIHVQVPPHIFALLLYVLVPFTAILGMPLLIVGAIFLVIHALILGLYKVESSVSLALVNNLFRDVTGTI